MTKRVYISGTLTCIVDPDIVKAFYEDLAKRCEAANFMSYVPHLHSDPIKHAYLTPKEVYEKDTAMVEASDLVIAYIGIESHGVGMEIEHAFVHAIPVVLLVEEIRKSDQKIKKTLGCPTVIKIITFSDHQDALQKIADYLASEELRILLIMTGFVRGLFLIHNLRCGRDSS